HGANRLGASALMQGLGDGYFILPSTVGDYLAGLLGKPAPSTDSEAFRASRQFVEDQTRQFLGINGTRSADDFHRQPGQIVWDKFGMERDAAGLQEAVGDIRALRDDFYRDLRVLGT